MEAATKRIVPGSEVCTLINVFTVAPERQAALVEKFEPHLYEVVSTHARSAP